MASNILFRTLGKRELRYLLNFVYERTYQPNEPIFQQGERGVGMYLISKGSIAITTRSPQGQVYVTSLGEGSFCGELALVDPEYLRSATATAVEKTIAVGFFKPDLIEILERNPAVGVKILFQLSIVLGRRLSATTQTITSLKSRHPKDADEDLAA